jgi:hypothetical protein
VKAAAIRVMRAEIIRGHARVEIIHRRPYDFDERRGVYVLREESREVVEEPRRTWRSIVDEIIDGVRMGRLSEETAYNLILNVGRVQMHKQVYGLSGLNTNGFVYIALTNDSAAPAAADTTLASEISTNGLARAIATTVTLPTGSGNQTTIDKTFTLTGTQACQKTALFDAASSGNMNHEIAFTARSLASGDTIETTFTLTLG